MTAPAVNYFFGKLPARIMTSATENPTSDPLKSVDGMTMMERAEK